MEIILKNTSPHKENLIYIIRQKELYQNKVNSSLVFTCNCKMGYSWAIFVHYSRLFQSPS